MNECHPQGQGSNKANHYESDEPLTAGSRFYRLVIDSLPTGVLTVNSEMRVTGVNPWAEKIIGFRADEVLGKFCGEVLKGDRCKTQCPVRAVLDSREPLSLMETTIENKWGEKIPVRMSCNGLFDDQGNLIGGVESFDDISHLKALEREKDNLISMLAHDIKSSVSIIGGFALRLLRRGKEIGEEKRNEYLEIVSQEAGKIEGLINELLEFSRLQSGQLKPNFSSVSLEKEILELLEAYETKAEEHGLTLELDSAHEMIIVEADARRMQRVFRNLLDNAIKYSQGKGTIKFTIDQNEDEVIVKVSDQGMGIPPEELPFIFDAFHRGSYASSREGSGLGLAEVKIIVCAHQGHITVESEPGKGSLFTIYLPKKQQKD